MIDDIINLFGTSMNPSVSTRRVQRVRHELHRRDVEVSRIDRVGASFVAVTFTGESLATFVSDGFDDHVKFMFVGADGEMVRRDYTPRHFDRRKAELTIEFALHGGGPRGSMVVPTDYDWHLLMGDATALPAIHRRLEELPAGTRAIVMAQVDDPADRRAMSSSADVAVDWFSTSAQLTDAARTLELPGGEGFVWAGGEASVMAGIRDIMLRDKGHPREAARISAYWRRGASDFHEDL
jgi:NADPH-dependent ferric siderophore reductase